MSKYELGSRLEYDNGDFIQLPAAVQLQVITKGDSSQLRAFLRIHTGARGATRLTTSPMLHLTAHQHIRIRSMIAEKVAQTGYRPNDFCLVGDVEMAGTNWYLADSDPSIMEAVHVKIEENVLELIVLNRPILYTDGNHWFSGNAQLVTLQEGVRELEASLHYQQGTLVSGTIGRRGEKRGIFVWSPRKSDSRMAMDILAEIYRMYPAAKKVVL